MGDDQWWREIRGDKFWNDRCQCDIPRISFCQKSQHPQSMLVPQLTRPQSQFNANQSIQIKMPPISPQHRSNNTQQDVQTKITSTITPKPPRTQIRVSEVVWEKVWRKMGKNMWQEIGPNNGAPGDHAGERFWVLEKTEPVSFQPQSNNNIQT